MCGIWALFGYEEDVPRDGAFGKIKHRGPDAWRMESEHMFHRSCLGFHRLIIVDTIYGMQPLKIHKYPHLTLLCNGEIYNCQRVEKEFGFDYETRCDVEAVMHLYAHFFEENLANGGEPASKKLKKDGESEVSFKECIGRLDGVFAFCLIDMKRKKVYLGRDAFGVRPIFRLRGGKDNSVLGVCSEAKGLVGMSSIFGDEPWSINPVKPGCYEEYNIRSDGTMKLVSDPDGCKYYRIGDVPLYKTLVPYDELSSSDIYANIRTLLTAAVKKRLMSNRRIGCFLSGGLDSSLISALLVKLAKEEGISYKVQSFSIGMGESPDIVAAREVAKHIGSEHHEVNFTEKDIADALDDVIYHLETADITTVRASVGMYLVSKYVLKNTDSTVILSGEGADEVAQGYIYFRNAPSAEDGHKESYRLLQDLYMYDVLRADRTTSAFSLELRVPFLDHQFTQYYLSLPAKLRQPKDGVEKYLLRKAFDGTGLIPDSILWRHKEAFSDGVASQKKSLFTVIQDIVESKVTDKALENACKKYPHCTPKTKESYYYRMKFEENYPGQSHWMPYFWMPKWTNVSDPSARFISHYAAKDKI
ncbi:asparagine synthetase [glutamine-hydrolyzing] [Ischnura elegans]|uniref:asparagine synthetase [glutamine-hydrolyzing] n=1 Tax=Ischnura elegans TaxID=197161 RepID=UPI001ED8ADFE|nr:asparagine synthetase [glutamine-hydrolyzing] [Ischnura elegans]